mgnify:CR=1 FL=1
MIWEVDAEGAKAPDRDRRRPSSRADKLILATDPDREGEAISWHVLEELRRQRRCSGDIDVERVVFNAVTEERGAPRP